MDSRAGKETSWIGALLVARSVSGGQAVPAADDQSGLGFADGSRGGKGDELMPTGDARYLNLSAQCPQTSAEMPGRVLPSKRECA